MCSHGEPPALVGTVPHTGGVPAPLGHRNWDLGALLLPSGMDMLGEDLAGGGSALPRRITAPGSAGCAGRRL